jgi:hypothetical protein
MVEGVVLGRILVVVCSRLDRMGHCHMVVGMVVVALEADAMLVGSLVIAVDMVGEAAPDHNVRSGS